MNKQARKNPYPHSHTPQKKKSMFCGVAYLHSFHSDELVWDSWTMGLWNLVNILTFYYGNWICLDFKDGE